MRLLLLIPFLVGCSVSTDLISEMRLDECEIGEVTIQGQLATSGNVLFPGNVQVHIHEVQTAETRPAWCSENE